MIFASNKVFELLHEANQVGPRGRIEARNSENYVNIPCVCLEAVQNDTKSKNRFFPPDQFGIQVKKCMVEARISKDLSININKNTLGDFRDL
jgi:hypothetical protein